MHQNPTSFSADSSLPPHAHSEIKRSPVPRRQNDQADAEAERHFRRMIENIGDYAILMLDIDGCVISWNEGVGRIKGYASEEIIGKSFGCFYPPEDILAGRPAQVLQLAQANGHFQEEGWRLRKDGSYFWAHVLISAIHDHESNLIGYSKITRDLTERHQAEQKLVRSNRLLEAIVDASPYSIITCDTHGLITSTNPATERMLAYTRNELIGKAVTEHLHDRQEIIARAAELTEKYGEVIEPGFDTFVHESRTGLVEKHEWTYIRKDGSRFPVHLQVTALRDDLDEISGFVGIAYDISERRRREEFTQHAAHHDELTGLPNRSLLYDRLNMALARAGRDKTKVGMLVVDVDHFKSINDSLGHHIGDEVLKVVSERILATVRGVDTVARMGGDEFVVLLSDLAEDAAADSVAAKIVKSIATPILIGEQKLSVTVSIGISCYPDDCDVAHLLLKHADTAMYATKLAGRHGYRRFSRELERIADNKLAMEAARRNALHEPKPHVH